MDNHRYEEIKYVLIEKVRGVPAIWDKNHAEHRNTYLLHKHWKRIAGSVDMRADKVRRLWRSLRQEFGNQVKKIIKSGCDAYETANSQWPFYPCLLFLKEQFIAGDASSNITDPDVDASTTFDDIQELDYKNHGMSNGMNSRSPSAISELPQNVSHSGYKRKRTFTEDRMERAPIQLDTQRKRHNSQNENDEDVAFFNSVLPHVRQLQSQQKMIFRMRLQQQLYELLYTPRYHQQSALYPSPPNQEDSICQVVYSNHHQ